MMADQPSEGCRLINAGAAVLCGFGGIREEGSLMAAGWCLNFAASCMPTGNWVTDTEVMLGNSMNASARKMLPWLRKSKQGSLKEGKSSIYCRLYEVAWHQFQSLTAGRSCWHLCSLRGRVA